MADRQKSIVQYPEAPKRTTLSKGVACNALHLARCINAASFLWDLLVAINASHALRCHEVGKIPHMLADEEARRAQLVEGAEVLRQGPEPSVQARWKANGTWMQLEAGGKNTSQRAIALFERKKMQNPDCSSGGAAGRGGRPARGTHTGTPQ